MEKDKGLNVMGFIFISNCGVEIKAKAQQQQNLS